MRNKKGAIEIQFNWIFILIVGAIILVFFLTIINKQKTIAEDQISSSIKINLGAILTGARAATSTASRINIPDIDIIFDCDGYIVGKANAIRSKHSFSPDLIKGPVIISWTKDWYMPYRVTNFLYVTTPFVRYIFIKDANGVVEEIYNTFPNRTIIDQGESKAFFTKDLIDVKEVANIKDLNHYKVRFIFAGSIDPETAEFTLPNLGGVKRKDYTAVKISATSYDDLEGVGELIFYEKAGDYFRETDRTVYLGEASAFGAIFADKAETYNCNMQRALNTLQIVNSIYLDRTGRLYDNSFSLSDGCDSPYLGAKGNMQEINSSIPWIRIGNTPALTINSLIYSKIYSKASRIKGWNEQALKLSCPAIY